MKRNLELQENLKNVLAQIPASTKLICVTKNFPASDIQILYQLGHRDFGENRVQELHEKALSLQSSCPDIRWHMIGHLQSNKLKKLLSVPQLAAIHSIDTIELLNKLIKSAYDKSLDIFLEIKTTSEDEKSGFETADQIESAVEILLSQKRFQLKGLMTIGSIRSMDHQKAATESFEKLISLKHDLDHKFKLIPGLELSMGMSSDYLLAIKMGSNYVRIGTKIMGNRENT